MSRQDDDILVRELGKLGEKSGQKGGSLVGGSWLAKAAGLGGSVGATLAAKFLPTETHTEKLVLSLSSEKALALGFSVLKQLGQIQDEDTSTSTHPCLKAVVGSGFLRMNPAVVYLEIEQGPNAGCEVTITAAAKEGLIKQHTAAKAVKQVLTALQKAAGTGV